jgi:hypothetical protein
MEVIDAEYQWSVYPGRVRLISPEVFFRDRRKLTFYFIAEKRIDFRELVRELFRYVLSRFPVSPYLNYGVDCIKPEFGWPHFKALATNHSDLTSSRHILCQKSAWAAQTLLTCNNLACARCPCLSRSGRPAVSWDFRALLSQSDVIYAPPIRVMLSDTCIILYQYQECLFRRSCVD